MSSSLFFLGWPDAADLSSHAAYQLRPSLGVHRRSSLIALSLAAVLLTRVPAGAQTGPAVWVAPSLHRVGMTDAPSTDTFAKVAAARNGHAAFQVVVNAPAAGLTNVNLALSDLRGPGTIPHTSFTLYREYYVNVTTSSPNLGGTNQPLGPGWYADGLVPFLDPVTGVPPVGGSITAVPCAVSSLHNQP